MSTVTLDRCDSCLTESDFKLTSALSKIFCKDFHYFKIPGNECAIILCVVFNRDIYKKNG